MTQATTPSVKTPSVKTPSVKTPGKHTKKSIVVDHRATALETCAVWSAGCADRVQALIAKNEKPAVEWSKIQKVLTNDGFVNALAMLQGVGAITTDNLTRMLPVMVKGDNYIQAKTMVKALNMITTLACGKASTLSDYTSQVLSAALENKNSLSIRGGLASLSRRVDKVDLPNSEHVTSSARYTPGTACAQNSQVRECLRVLGLASTHKGVKGDTMHLVPERVENLRKLYSLDAV